MSFFLMGNSLTHIFAGSGLWLIIQQMSELKAILEILRFIPFGLWMSIWGTEGEFQCHTEEGLIQAGRWFRWACPNHTPCPLPPPCTSPPLVEKEIVIVKHFFRVFFPSSLSPLSHINMCLSLGCRQVSLKLSSDQRKKAIFWQNKKCPCDPRRPRKAKFSHK